MRNEALRKIVYEEVVVPSRNDLTLEAARAEATDVLIAQEISAAEDIDRFLDIRNLVSKRFSNIELKEIQLHFWACRFTGKKSDYHYVKTVPNLDGWGVIHKWNKVRGHYGKFQAPQICNRVLSLKSIKEVNADRAKRKLQPLVVLDDELADVPDAEAFRHVGTRISPYGLSLRFPSRDSLEADECQTAKLLHNAPVNEKHPWMKLSAADRAFYRGFFAKNVEERRKFLDEYGLSKALEVMRAKLLDMDSTVHNGTRALYELDLPHANALVCSCSTTQRVFLIWVPKTAKTCAAADVTLSHGLEQEKCIGAA